MKKFIRSVPKLLLVLGVLFLMGWCFSMLILGKYVPLSKLLTELRAEELSTVISLLVRPFRNVGAVSFIIALGVFVVVMIFLLEKSFKKQRQKAVNEPTFKDELGQALEATITALNYNDEEKLELAIHDILNTLEKHNFPMERLMHK